MTSLCNTSHTCGVYWPAAGVLRLWFTRTCRLRCTAMGVQGADALGVSQVTLPVHPAPSPGPDGPSDLEAGGYLLP